MSWHVRVFFKVILAVLVGLVATVCVVQRTQQFKAIVQRQLTVLFAQQLNVSFTGKIRSINLFVPTVELEDVLCTPLNQAEGWRWEADSFCVRSSWIDYSTGGIFILTADFKGYQAISQIIDGSLALNKHINKFIENFQPDVPVELRALKFHDAQLKVVGDNKVQFESLWNGSIDRLGQSIKSMLRIHQGVLIFGDTTLFSQASGTIQCSLNTGIPFHYDLMTDMRFRSVQLAPGKDTDQWCALQSTVHDGNGSLTVRSANGQLAADLALIKSHKEECLCKVTATAPLPFCLRLAGQQFFAQNATGTCTVLVEGTPTKLLSGTCTIDHPRYSACLLDSVGLSFVIDRTTARGYVNIQKGLGRFAGTWYIDLQKFLAGGSVINATAWPVNGYPEWAIEPGQGRVDFTVDPLQAVAASYTVAARHQKTEEMISSQGSVTLSAQGILEAHGNIADKNYSLGMRLFPTFQPLHVTYAAAEHKELFGLVPVVDDAQTFEITVSYDAVRSVMRDLFDYDLLGEGCFKVRAIHKDGQVKGSLRSEGLTVRVPETYNFVSSITGNCSFDFSRLQFETQDFLIKLHRGTLTCARATVALNNTFEVAFAHIPLCLNKCFFNWKQSFFSVASGLCLFQKRQEEPYSIDGFILIQKGQLKENPLSSEAHKELTHFMVPAGVLTIPDLKLNVSIMTDDPLTIKTAQLESQAVIDLKLSHALKSVEPTGTLKLMGGVIQFPYSPLYITRAQLQFVKNQPYDPLIDLVAQGTFKRYNITLSVSGNSQDPVINLSSIPVLTQEQIITLLLTGSIEESLNVMVPALLAHNVEGILFGSAQDRDPENWFDPLKRIRIVPSFSDQTGRGGFRGTIEIDVSDNLHAKIQKNFSLSEDVRIEAEYLFSDDIGVRVIRDERSDLGAEIEMRLKF